MKGVFYGRLKESFPSQVIVDVTEVCNLECIHCPHPEFKKSEVYAARYLEPALNAKAVSEVAERGAQYIRYTAEGEPLIHPLCYDFLDDAVKRSQTFVTLTTNGTLLNEKRIRKLLDSGLHMIDVSIDSHKPETFKAIRKGDLEVVVTNVMNLAKWATGTKTKIVVSFVEQPLNAAEVQEFTEFWEPWVSKVVIRRLHSASNAIKWVGLKQKDREPCVYPWERITLSPDGWLKFCPQEWFGGAKVADYRGTTIYETWHGLFYAKLRAAHVTGNCFGCCKDCPDWQQTRWPGEGLGYADLVAEMS